MLKKGFILTAAIMIGAGLNYVFHFSMVRILDAVSYGNLSVLIGLLTIMLVPTLTIKTALTREIVKMKSELKIGGLLRKWTERILVYGAIGAFLVILLSPHIASSLNDASLTPYIQLIGASLLVFYLASIPVGYLQGKEKIWSLSFVNIIDPIGKLLVGISLVIVGFGLLGATASLVVGSLIVLVVFSGIFINGFRNSVKISFGHAFLPMLSTTVLITAYMYLDLFFVKGLLGAEQAGIYNVAAITSRILFFSISGLNVMFLIRTSQIDASAYGKKVKKMFLKVMALLVPTTVVFFLFPTQIIEILYGAAYSGAIEPFLILVGGMFLFSVFNIFLNFFWSQKKDMLPLLLSVAAIIVDVILLSLLVPAYGTIGAATATSLTAAVFLLPSIIFFNKAISL